MDNDELTLIQLSLALGKQVDIERPSKGLGLGQSNADNCVRRSRKG